MANYKERVICRVCGEEFKQITNQHLKRHNITIAVYREKYPNAPLKSRSAVAFLGQRRPEHAKKLRKEKVLKVCEGCGKEFRVLPCREHRKFCSIECYMQNANPMDNPKSRAKLSKSLKGKKLSLEHRLKLSKALKGKPRSEETKDKISRTKTEQWSDPEFKTKMLKADKGWRKRFLEEGGEFISSFKGKHHTMETRERLSKIKKKWHENNDNPFKGKKHSPETIEKIREVQLELWSDENYKERQLKKIFEGRDIRPTSIEKELMNLVEEYNLPFKYVGDGHTFIASKCPDFINFENKLIIELFGDYWHKSEEKQERIAHFSKYGYRTLVIWEHELNNLSEREIVSKINAFIDN